MGVDYYTCETCSTNFPDCGPHGYCICENILCGWCHDKFVKQYGETETDDYGTVSNGCDICKLVKPSDFDLIKYLLYVTGRKREDVEAALRAEVEANTYNRRTGKAVKKKPDA
jgi:hypothetical protein